MGQQVCSSCCRTEVAEKLEGSQKIFDREKRILEHKQGEGKIDDVYKIDVGKDGVLSNGTVGTIFKAQHLKNKTIRAVKQMNKKNVKGDRWQKEIDMLKRLDHPHICKLYETWEDTKTVYLIMELCRGGDLMNLALRSDKVNEGLIAVLVRQMCSATAHLHYHEVIHSDMRPENWLFDEPVQPTSSVLDLNLKMIDFGLAAKHTPDEEGGGSRRPSTAEDGDAPAAKKEDAAPTKKKNVMHEKAGAYCKAPEQISTKDKFANISDKCDVWAIGVITFLLLSGEPPFPRSAGKFKEELIRQAKFEFVPEATWKAISTECKDFISSSLQKVAEDRPTAKEALASPWMMIAKDVLDEAYDLQGKKASGAAQGKGRGKGGKPKLSILDAPLPSAGNIMDSFKKMGKMNSLEKAAVTAAAHRLPSDKVAYLRKTYEKMDRNGDGILSAQELCDGLKETGVGTEELLESLMAIDTDGSGVIEYTEFIAATYHFQRTMQEDVIWSIFRIFDTDGSGSVTLEELKKALAEGGGQHAKNIEDYFQGQSVNDLIKDLDGNGDGEIDFEEFKALLNRPKG